MKAATIQIILNAEREREALDPIKWACGRPDVLAEEIARAIDMTETEGFEISFSEKVEMIENVLY